MGPLSRDSAVIGVWKEEIFQWVDRSFAIIFVYLCMF